MTDRDELIGRLKHTQKKLDQITDVATIKVLTQLSVELKDDLAKADRIAIGLRSI